MTMKYCGIERVDADKVTVLGVENPFSSDLEDGCLLGDKIMSALYDGADVGVQVTPTYDSDVEDDSSSHDVDLMSSPNHDFFDIAEATGKMIDSQSFVETKPDSNE